MNMLLHIITDYLKEHSIKVFYESPNANYLFLEDHTSDPVKKYSHIIQLVEEDICIETTETKDYAALVLIKIPLADPHCFNKLLEYIK
jgi:hypothetical protein